MRRLELIVRSAAVAAFFVTAAAVAQQATMTDQYFGMMPCADCSGIKTTITLTRSVQGTPVDYTMTETFIGRQPAGRMTGGTWTIEHGDAADKNATVYQLHQTGSKAVISFVKVGDELRMLGGDMMELPASVPHTLKLLVADEAVVKSDGQKGANVTLKVGGELEVQLAANHTTGYSWAAVPVENPVLMGDGKATYQENTTEGKAGVGGVEIWRFKAAKAGKEDLKFEYRRPWEKSAQPAKTVTFNVTVQ